MAAVRIIPCLDVDKGVVVKGIRFLNLRRKGDPVEMASRYEELGADELVFLDITATVEDRSPLYRLVKDVASTITIPFTVGGGVRSVEDVGSLLDSGADKVSINTTALRKPEVVERAAWEYGSQAIVVAIDAKRTGGSWEVYVAGGRIPTGVDAIEWAVKAQELGAGELLVTSIDMDGTREGYDLQLLRTITSRVSVPVIASGGAGRLEHFYEAYKAGAHALLAAGLFHDGILTPAQVKSYLAKRGVEVRLE
ncbi:MAG: imidazole glycerol phosphate synthase subunit HisF [Desulfurococcales archaeon]|nr:imidazole glycerol phosphate synthase subunit HisF [Desulfurococcales archaeon]